MKGTNASYIGNIVEGIISSFTGLKLTFRHFFQALKKRKPIGIADDNYFKQQTGIVTLQYPQESFPVPDNGRYRLYNEIEDCIVCDLCAKICPVNCIEIEAVKATEEIGKTSDGTTKRIYAAKFDIDMAKCCYCGLCTTVCPTECLTMTKAYDFSEFDVRNMTYHFTDLTPEQATEKKQLLSYAQLAAKQKSEKSNTDLEPKNIPDESASEKKPIFKPSIKAPAVKALPEDLEGKVNENTTPKPAFKPVIKSPVIKKNPEVSSSEEQSDKVSPGDKENTLKEATPDLSKPPKLVFKPVIKSPGIKKEEIQKGEKEEGKAVNENKQKDIEGDDSSLKEKTPKVIPFKPVIKPPKRENSSDPENPK